MKTFSIGPNDGALFDEYVRNNSAFVKFYNPGCYFCNKMAPAWKELENIVNDESFDTHNFLVIEVHSDALKDIKSECGKHIQGYPTLIEVKEGGIIGKEHLGSRDLETLLNFLYTIIETSNELNANENNIFQNKEENTRKMITKPKMYLKPKNKRRNNSNMVEKPKMYLKPKNKRRTKGGGLGFSSEEKPAELKKNPFLLKPEKREYIYSPQLRLNDNYKKYSRKKPLEKDIPPARIKTKKKTVPVRKSGTRKNKNNRNINKIKKT